MLAPIASSELQCIRRGTRKRAALVAGALVLIPFSASLVRADPAFTLTNHDAWAGIDGEPDYPTTAMTADSIPLAHGIQMFGQFGAVTGAEYLGDPTNVVFIGDFNDVVPSGGTFHAAGDVTFTFTGGDVTLLRVDTLVPVLETFGSIPDIAAATSGQPISFAYDTTYDSDPPPGDTTFGSWHLRIQFSWTGFAPTDTLTLTVPEEHPIELTNNSSVPEPTAGVTLLGLSTISLLKRRPRN